MTYTEFARRRTYSLTIGPTLFDCDDDSVRQFCRWLPLSFRLATLGDLISHILNGRRGEKMDRIAAWRVIAGMTDLESIRDRAVSECPSGTMSVKLAMVVNNRVAFPVFLRIPTTKPRPTSIGAAGPINARPKASLLSGTVFSVMTPAESITRFALGNGLTATAGAILGRFWRLTYAPAVMAVNKALRLTLDPAKTRVRLRSEIGWLTAATFAEFGGRANIEEHSDLPPGAIPPDGDTSRGFQFPSIIPHRQVAQHGY